MRGFPVEKTGLRPFAVKNPTPVRQRNDPGGTLPSLRANPCRYFSLSGRIIQEVYHANIAVRHCP
jgi:hypothetical protein